MMTRIILPILVLALVGQSLAFPAKLHHGFHPQIVGGENAKPGSVPFQVSLQNRTGTHLCGGSLLNERYVITAGHCMDGVNASSIIVVTGATDLSQDEEFVQRLPVKRIKVHEEFTYASEGNDVSLLELESPAELGEGIRTEAIRLVAKDTVPTGNVTVTGWGVTYEGIFPPILQTVDVTLISHVECEEAYNRTLHDTMICAGRPYQGSCYGDSGGPLVWREADGELSLVGIVSWGPIECGVPDYPGVYSNVAKLVDWIQANAV